MPLSLAWSAPPECPPAQAVSVAVERLVTKDPPEPLEVTVRVERRGERFAAEIRTPTGKRELEGESCRAVAEATAMVLALAIDPDARSSEAAFAAFDDLPQDGEREQEAPAPVTPVAESPSKSAAPPAVARAEPPARVEPPADDGGSWSFSVLGLGELGMLPQPTLGGAVGIGGVSAPWSAELGAMLLAPREGTLEGDSSRGGELGYAGGYAAGCLRPIAARKLDTCVTLEAGRLGGTAFGVTNPTPNAAFWIAPGVMAALHVPLAGALHGEIRLGAALALERPEFGLDGLGPVHRPALVTLRGQAGVSFR